MDFLTHLIVSILIALGLVAAPVSVPAPVATSTSPVLYQDADITIYAPVINGVQTQPEDWTYVPSPTTKLTPTLPPAPTTYVTPSGAIIDDAGGVLYSPPQPAYVTPEPSAPQSETPAPVSAYTPPPQNNVTPPNPNPTEQECKTIYAHRTGSSAWYRCQALFGNQ